MSFSKIKAINQRLEDMDLHDRLFASMPNVSHDVVSGMIAAYASAYTQKTRLIKLQIGDGRTYSERLLPHSVEGFEALSSPSRYEVVCLSPDAYIRTENLEGLPAQISISINAAGLPSIPGRPEREKPTEMLRCGIITRADTLPSDGGFARYKLIIESPLALLKHRRTSRLFQDMRAKDIVQQIVSEHAHANSSIGCVFEVKSLLRGEYKVHSYRNQYRESDLKFIERILFKDGISYRWEYEGGETPKCRLVLFDRSYDLPEAAHSPVRFHRAAVTEKEDSITEWTESHRIGSVRTRLNTYDYKPANTTEMIARGAPVILGPQGGKDEDVPVERSLEDYDTKTLYYGNSPQDLLHYAELRQEVHDRKKSSYHAEGNLRPLMVGEWFQLENYPIYKNYPQEECEFVTCVLEFNAHNNLPNGLKDYLSQPQGQLRSILPKNHEEGKEAPPYWVRLSLRKRGLPLTPEYARTRHARPTANGIQTAIVTGPENEEVYTDQYGRVRIQFHWQKGPEHPKFGANFDERSSCWVRVAYPSAGLAWGSQYIPRIGQEVLVDFIENDIDRPIITGVIHNGKQPTPRFSSMGRLPANRTLSGIKTKEFHGQLFSELIFDDTQGQVRTRLSTEHGKTQLNEGFLIHPRENGEGEPRGEGFELRTDRSGALRAAEGLLLSAYGRKDAGGGQLDRAETIALLELALSIAKDLSQSAQAHHADDTDTVEQERLLRDARQWEDGSNTAKDAPVKSNKAILTATAPDGIALAADANLNLSAGSNIDQVALQDNNLSVGRNLRMRIGEAFSLFVKKLGMKLIAAAGKIQVQAQDGEIEIGAAKKLHLYSLEEILIEAPKVTIRGQNGSVEYGEGILSRTTAAHIQHAGNISMPGPASVTAQLPGMPASTMKTNERFVMVYPSGEAVKGVLHQIRDRQNTVEESGATGEVGKTNQVHGAAIAPVSMKLEMPEAPENLENLFTGPERESGLFDEQAQLVAPPIEGVPYFIELEDGRTFSGRIGADGLLPRIETQKEEELIVYWGDEALAKMEGA